MFLVPVLVHYSAHVRSRRSFGLHFLQASDVMKPQTRTRRSILVRVHAFLMLYSTRDRLLRCRARTLGMGLRGCQTMCCHLHEAMHSARTFGTFSPLESHEFHLDDIIQFPVQKEDNDRVDAFHCHSRARPTVLWPLKRRQPRPKRRVCSKHQLNAVCPSVVHRGATAIGAV